MSLLLGSALSVVTFAGACKFTSCETTRTCAPTDEDPLGLGGGGGVPLGSTEGGGAGGEGGGLAATGGAVGVDGEPCSVGNILCDGVCTDPLYSRQFCGATGSCQGSVAGEECLGDEVCSEGECTNECADGRLNCEGTCIDPLTDEDFCGAVGACGSKEEAGTRCEGEELCVYGVCRSWGSATSAGLSGISTSSTSVQLFSQPNGDATLFWANPGSPGSIGSSQFSDVDVSWSASTTLTSNLLDDYLPSFDMNSAGGAFVSWTEKIGNTVNHQLFGSTRVSGGEDWSPTGQLTTNVYDDAFGDSAHPDVAIDSLGNRFLVWPYGAGGYRWVRARVWSSESETWLPSVPLSEDADADSVAKVAALNGGEALAVWSEIFEEDRVLRSSVVSEDGVTTPKLVFQDTSLEEVTSPRLVSSGASDAQVVFFARPSTNAAWQIWGASYEDGAWDSAQQLGEANNAQVRMNDSGDAIVIWQAGETIYVTRKESAASDWTAPLPLATHPTIETPSVAIDAAGNIVVVWSADHEGDQSIFGIRYDAQEGLWSEPVALEQESAHFARPVVALDDSGRALVVFFTGSPWFVRYE